MSCVGGCAGAIGATVSTGAGAGDGAGATVSTGAGATTGAVCGVTICWGACVWGDCGDVTGVVWAGDADGKVTVPSVAGYLLTGSVAVRAGVPSGASAEGAPATLGTDCGLAVAGASVESAASALLTAACDFSAAPNAAVMPRIAVADNPVDKMRADWAT